MLTVHAMLFSRSLLFDEKTLHLHLFFVSCNFSTATMFKFSEIFAKKQRGVNWQNLTVKIVTPKPIITVKFVTPNPLVWSFEVSWLFPVFMPFPITCFKYLFTITDSANCERHVVKVESVDPLTIRQESEDDPAQSVCDPDHRQKKAGVVFFDPQQQRSILSENRFRVKREIWENLSSVNWDRRVNKD